MPLPCLVRRRMAWLLIHNTGELQTVHMDKRQLVQVRAQELEQVQWVQSAGMGVGIGTSSSWYRCARGSGSKCRVRVWVQRVRTVCGSVLLVEAAGDGAGAGASPVQRAGVGVGMGLVAAAGAGAGAGAGADAECGCSAVGRCWFCMRGPSGMPVVWLRQSAGGAMAAAGLARRECKQQAGPRVTVWQVGAQHAQ